MLLLTWAGTIPLKKGERTRLACSQSRLGEDFNPPISSHRTVKTKRAIRVFSRRQTETPEACAPLSTVSFRCDHRVRQKVRVNNSATIRLPKTLLSATNPARIEISQPS